MALLYIGGKAVNTDEDTLIIEYTGENLFGAVNPKSCESKDMLIQYDRVYVTKKRTYYRITKREGSREIVALLSPEDAARVIEENAAYILTENYDQALGKPERA